MCIWVFIDVFACGCVCVCLDVPVCGCTTYMRAFGYLWACLCVGVHPCIWVIMHILMCRCTRVCSSFHIHIDMSEYIRLRVGGSVPLYLSKTKWICTDMSMFVFP